MIQPLKIIILVLFSLLLSKPGTAQTASADEVLSELYESLTFSEAQDPDYQKFKSLFIEGARLISVRDTVSYTLTVQDFIENMDRQRKSGSLVAFKEFEIDRKVDRYGHIQQVFSTYETAIETSEGITKTRGINSIQLLRKRNQWKIASLIWYEENDNFPLPKEYLPN